MREHSNDVPGDIVGEDAENLPGGFGTDDPDNDADAVYDERYPLKIYHGEDRITTGMQGGDTIAGETEAQGEDATVSSRDLLAGNEGNPGAAIGFIGAENDKQVIPETTPGEKEPTSGLIPEGGLPDDSETEQQQRNMSVETEGPAGGGKAA